MKVGIVLILVLVFLGIGGEVRADPVVDTTGEIEGFVAAGASAAISALFLVIDAAYAARHQRGGPTFGRVEIAVFSLQLVLGISIMATSAEPSSGIPTEVFVPLGAAMTAVALPFLWHGWNESRQVVVPPRVAPRALGFEVLPSVMGNGRAVGVVARGVF